MFKKCILLRYVLIATILFLYFSSENVLGDVKSGTGVYRSSPGDIPGSIDEIGRRPEQSEAALKQELLGRLYRLARDAGDDGGSGDRNQSDIKSTIKGLCDKISSFFGTGSATNSISGEEDAGEVLKEQQAKAQPFDISVPRLSKTQDNGRLGQSPQETMRYDAEPSDSYFAGSGKSNDADNEPSRLETQAVPLIRKFLFSNMAAIQNPGMPNTEAIEKIRSFLASRPMKDSIYSAEKRQKNCDEKQYLCKFQQKLLSMRDKEDAAGGRGCCKGDKQKKPCGNGGYIPGSALTSAGDEDRVQAFLGNVFIKHILDRLLKQTLRSDGQRPPMGEGGGYSDYGEDYYH